MANQPALESSLLDHPKGLSVIFFTEMWERFGYYGMRALLILYMTKAFLFSDDKAYGIYGSFTAFVYITPILGGIIADRILGFKKSSILGAAIMALGYFVLAIPNIQALQEIFFYCALALIIIGNGLFKPNTASLVGNLYNKEDIRKDAGYTIFYMGINLGSILAPIACGYVGEVYGWNYGFLLTGIGLVGGLITFLLGQKHLENIGNPPRENFLNQSYIFNLTPTSLILIAIVLATPIIAFVLTGHLTGVLLNITAIITISYIAYLAKNSPIAERKKIIALILMMFFYTCFFATFEQAGSSVTLFTDRNVDRMVHIFTFDFEIPTTFFQSVNPIFIIILAPMMAKLWIVLAKKNLEPSAPIKFTIALLFAALGYVALSMSANYSDAAGQVPMIWLLLSYLLITTGELSISPVGLSMVSKLAPTKLLGLLMGALMLSIAFGNYIAAILAKLASGTHSPDEIVNGVQTLDQYVSAFNQIALFAVVFALILSLFIPVINRLSQNKPIFKKKLDAAKV